MYGKKVKKISSNTETGQTVCYANRQADILGRVSAERFFT